MFSNLRKYLSLSRVSLLLSLQYKMNTFFLLGVVIVPPVAYFFLWNSIYHQKEIIGNYKLSEMIKYYIIVYLFFETKPHAWWDIGHSIKDGRFSLYITKPMNHFLFYFFYSYSFTILWWIFAIFGAFFLFIIFKNYFVLPKILPFFLSFFFSFLGGILGFTIEYIFNLFAFWIEKPFGLLRFYDLLIYFLSGSIIPLDLLPFKNFFLFLPFKYLSFFPVSIFLGKAQNINLFNEFLNLILWICFFIIISQIVFYFGRKTYSAPGSL
jgi:ABC-2 type transport system permease protein